MYETDGSFRHDYPGYTQQGNLTQGHAELGSGFEGQLTEGNDLDTPDSSGLRSTSVCSEAGKFSGSTPNTGDTGARSVRGDGTSDKHSMVSPGSQSVHHLKSSSTDCRSPVAPEHTDSFLFTSGRLDTSESLPSNNSKGALNPCKPEAASQSYDPCGSGFETVSQNVVSQSGSGNTNNVFFSDTSANSLNNFSNILQQFPPENLPYDSSKGEAFPSYHRDVTAQFVNPSISIMASNPHATFFGQHANQRMTSPPATHAPYASYNHAQPGVACGNYGLGEAYGPSDAMMFAGPGDLYNYAADFQMVGM